MKNRKLSIKLKRGMPKYSIIWYIYICIKRSTFLKSLLNANNWFVVDDSTLKPPRHSPSAVLHLVPKISVITLTVWFSQSAMFGWSPLFNCFIGFSWFIACWVNAFQLLVITLLFLAWWFFLLVLFYWHCLLRVICYLLLPSKARYLSSSIHLMR